MGPVCGLSGIRQIRLSGFRMVSDEAVLVLAKTIPIDILGNKTKRIHFLRLKYPDQIHTYGLGYYKTSVTVIYLASHAACVVCVNLIYEWRVLRHGGRAA